jgi:hypothetical protein
MTNNLSINKDDLCKIMTPELINDIVDGIWWAEDNGWEEREKVEQLQIEIDKMADFCDIVRPKNDIYGKYTKKR